MVFRFTCYSLPMATPIKLPRTTARRTSAKPKVLTLMVELEDCTPSIWRRIHVDSRAHLDALHHVLQAAMGWTDAHLHEFTIVGKRYAKPDQDDEMFGIESLDEAAFTLGQVLRSGSVFEYLYDFGDSWRHTIKVVSTRSLANDLSAGRQAWVEDGQGACPPEDFGGIGQYQDFLKNFKEDPYSDETLEIREWAGMDFDPTRFDRQAANAAIDRMLWNGWISIAT